MQQSASHPFPPLQAHPFDRAITNVFGRSLFGLAEDIELVSRANLPKSAKSLERLGVHPVTARLVFEGLEACGQLEHILVSEAFVLAVCAMTKADNPEAPAMRAHLERVKGSESVALIDRCKRAIRAGYPDAAAENRFVSGQAAAWALRKSLRDEAA